MKTLRIIALLILAANYTFAQSNAGEIFGRVTDEKKEGLEFATVQAYIGGILKGGSKTDINGNYSIKPLSPGNYDLKISYVGMITREINDIPLGNDGRRKVDVQLEKRQATGPKKDIIVTATRFEKPLVDASDPSSSVMGAAAIKQAPTQNT